ncbi:hypothetical protein DXT99_03650 [Pontibacter diazotrophicus]|uniref:Thioredoxin family protein n=1 Tax=Pontibacter diazotrophicus TaxID=1400979 RepID=A0A3D8LFZ4_9BACT|nr:hypothetical protein [Pontibacter diazotrophicus]RDV16313.1 hypothetical protein DXT99_03650 [Pontibacter diazotrophicus]
MKTLLTICFFLLLIIRFSYSQQIQFENDALPEVMAKAKRTGKPVFILVESRPHVSPNLSEEARKAWTDSGLYDPAVTGILNKEFLNVKAPYGSALARQMQQQYNVQQYPTYLYFDSDGGLVYRQGSTTTSVERYLSDIEEFKQRKAANKSVSYYQRELVAGRRDADFIKSYILLLNELGLTVEQVLLNVYVDALPAKAFNSFAEVVFIHQQGPHVDSKAFKRARFNQKLVDSLYTTLPLQERISINNLIISNTMEEAIAKRDRDLAYKGASFARGTYTTDYKRGNMTFQNNMMRFYNSTGDTAQYLQLLVSYVDEYYMGVPVDSVEQMLAADSAAMAASRDRMRLLSQNKPNSDSVQVHQRAYMRTGAQPNAGRSHLMMLNNSAYAVYRTGTTNNRYLTRALSWSKRAVELAPNSGYYDTLAHLLYKLEFYTEAEAMQEKAVEMARTENAHTHTEHLQQELIKIKNRSL